MSAQPQPQRCVAQRSALQCIRALGETQEWSLPGWRGGAQLDGRVVVREAVWFGLP